MIFTIFGFPCSIFFSCNTGYNKLSVFLYIKQFLKIPFLTQKKKVCGCMPHHSFLVFLDIDLCATGKKRGNNKNNFGSFLLS